MTGRLGGRTSEWTGRRVGGRSESPGFTPNASGVPEQVNGRFVPSSHSSTQHEPGFSFYDTVELSQFGHLCSRFSRTDTSHIGLSFSNKSLISTILLGQQITDGKREGGCWTEARFTLEAARNGKPCVRLWVLRRRSRRNTRGPVQRTPTTPPPVRIVPNTEITEGT